jgi:hypothetical protein
MTSASTHRWIYPPGLSIRDWSTFSTNNSEILFSLRFKTITKKIYNRKNTKKSLLRSYTSPVTIIFIFLFKTQEFSFVPSCVLRHTLVVVANTYNLFCQYTYYRQWKEDGNQVVYFGTLRKTTSRPVDDDLVGWQLRELVCFAAWTSKRKKGKMES